MPVSPVGLPCVQRETFSLVIQAINDRQLYKALNRTPVQANEMSESFSLDNCSIHRDEEIRQLIEVHCGKHNIFDGGRNFLFTFNFKWKEHFCTSANFFLVHCPKLAGSESGQERQWPDSPCTIAIDELIQKRTRRILLPSKNSIQAYRKGSRGCQCPIYIILYCLHWKICGHEVWNPSCRFSLNMTGRCLFHYQYHDHHHFV